jgi:putative monooxygenase
MKNSELCIIEGRYQMKYVIDSEKVEGVRRMPSRVSKLLLSEFSVGAKNLSMGVNITDVGSMIPRHAHEGGEEAMFIIGGKGTFVVEDEEQEVRPGMAIYIPPGVEHSIVNIGEEELKLVWVYSPPLPEHGKQQK